MAFLWSRKVHFLNMEVWSGLILLTIFWSLSIQTWMHSRRIRVPTLMKDWELSMNMIMNRMIQDKKTSGKNGIAMQQSTKFKTSTIRILMRAILFIRRMTSQVMNRVVMRTGAFKVLLCWLRFVSSMKYYKIILGYCIKYFSLMLIFWCISVELSVLMNRLLQGQVILDFFIALIDICNVWRDIVR